MTMNLDPRMTPSPASDMLVGAEAIAQFLRGPSADRAQVYRLIRKRSGIPVFRLNRTLCARRSKLVEWIEAQEKSGH